jgi:hypothetical protein
MCLETLSPALAVLSLRAIRDGKKPHISKGLLCAYLAGVIQGGYFANLTPADFAEARSQQRQNNRARKARAVQEAPNA